MREPRVAVFRERIVLNINENSNASLRSTSQQWFGKKRLLVESDPFANSEILRLLKEQTCLYCKTLMQEVSNIDRGSIFLCPKCGYWGGRGSRIDGPNNTRGVMGSIHQVDLNSPELVLSELIGHFKQLPEHLLKLSPNRAEKVVIDLLNDVLDCEVRPLGGVKDGGVDGYIIANDKIKSIVQVKWHRNKNKAESVKLIREVAGTLLARGVPNGLLVTTYERASSYAKKEIEELKKREIVGLGNIQIDVKTYNDILDMLDIAWVKRGSNFEKATPWLMTDDHKFEIFG